MEGYTRWRGLSDTGRRPFGSGTKHRLDHGLGSMMRETDGSLAIGYSIGATFCAMGPST
jgi:hypothetical protein